MTDSTDSDDYKVGYGKPPKATQFGNREQPIRKKNSIKEVCGNLASILDQKTRVQQRGKERWVHPHEAQLSSLAKRALNGEIQAIRLFIQHCEKAGVLEYPQAATNHLIIVPHPLQIPRGVNYRLRGLTGMNYPFPKDIEAKVRKEFEQDKAVMDNIIDDFEHNKK